MKVILYPRVSSKKQAMSGDSIEAQERRLKSYCEEKGYEIIDVWTDAGKSATFGEGKKTIRIRNGLMIAEFDLRQRPAFQKIIEKAGSGIFDAIVFYKWDRAFRDVVFAKLSQQFLKDKGVELIPTDDSSDPLASSIMQILSEEEIRKMKERVRSVRLERFSNGLMVSRSPFGYRPIIRNKKIVGFKPHPKEADVVKDVFKMALEGQDYKVIIRKHNLRPPQYYNILKNKAYVGYIEFEGNLKQGSHKPLVSLKDWIKINGELSSH